MNQVKGVLLALLLGVLVIPIACLGYAFVVTSGIILYQLSFWGVLAIGTPIIFFGCRWSGVADPIWSTIVWVPLFFVYYTAGFYAFSGVADTTLINAQVSYGVWEEQHWTYSTVTTCTREVTNKDGSTTCVQTHEDHPCDTFHPDEYTVVLSDGKSISVSEQNYRALVGMFANQEQRTSINLYQCSPFDGRKFVTEFRLGRSVPIFGSYAIPVVNWTLAGHNPYQMDKSIAEPYKNLLRPMPDIVEHPAGVGPFGSPRLIVAGTDMPPDWKDFFNNGLDEINGTLGPTKQVNVVVYVVGTADPGFARALEAYWSHGKKNQLTIVVGSRNFPVIEWAHVIGFWSANPAVVANLENIISRLTLDSPQLLPSIRQQVEQSWERRQMKTFQYLAYDLSIPIGWTILIILCCALAAVGIGRGIQENA